MFSYKYSQSSLHALSTHTHSIEDLTILSSSLDQINNKSCERLANRKTKLFSQSENQLIKSYMQAVSRQYKLTNKKSHCEQDNSSINSQSQVKRKIRLSSTKDKRAARSIAREIITPIKAINNENYDHLEVIKAHLRRKTAGTAIKNDILTLEKGFKTNFKSNNKKTGNKFVINSSFSDQIDDDSESIFSPIEKEEPLPIPSHQTSYQNNRNSRKYKILYPKPQVQKGSVYCPICEQKLQIGKIVEHQKLCSKLEDLYNLTQQKLLQYIKWKIQMHMHQLKSALEHQQSCEDEFVEQNPESKSVHKLTQKKTIVESEVNKPSLTNLLDLCEQQIQKCKWFLRIKMEIQQKQNFL